MPKEHDAIYFMGASPAPPPLLAGGGLVISWVYVLPGAFFPAEKSIGPKAVLGQVALRLGILGKGPALAPLTVTAQDDGGANALDEPLVFAVSSAPARPVSGRPTD